jgi:aspartyl-tRNA(Asn)/glutamyl-tRNA(Gln) amidotransferase subunit A
MEPYELTVAAAAREIREARLSPVELVESVLGRIAEVDGRVDAFCLVDADGALAAAKRAEAEISADGPRGPLHGVPVSLKDRYDVAGQPTRSGCRAYDGHRAERDSTVAARLRSGGAVIVGKVRTHEMAKGVTTHPTRNPWDLGRTPGGSSGGSAAAVAAMMGPASMGTDTGGSVRIPAAACGGVGLKPTYGLVGCTGLRPLSWSFDHPGPLTRTVTDAALLLNAVAGHDPADPASLDVPTPDYTAELDRGVAGLTVGLPTDYFFDGCDPEVSRAVLDAVGTLTALGARVREVTIPMKEEIVAVSRTIIGAESAAAELTVLRERGHLYGDGVRLSLESGALISAADYITALRARERMRREWHAMFATIDVLVAPTLPTAPPRYGEEEVTLADGSTVAALPVFAGPNYPADAVGLPALQVPVGVGAAGLPIGMQIIGRPLAEPTVLRVGRACEAASPHAGRTPEL